MSYSFSVKADTKDDAIHMVADQLDQIVTSQPIHAADRHQALDAAHAFIAVLQPTDTECINVSMSGSLSWRDADTFTGASLNIRAYVSVKA